ncbi:MAG: HU family DNA-binding protein [Gammaproteobacteria bacterium]
MTKTELVEALAKKQHQLNKTDIDLAVNCIFDYMSQALVENQRIEIRGFGAFSLRYLAPRRGRNPFSGEVLHLPASYSVHFKPGKELRQRVAESGHRGQIAGNETEGY